MQGTFKEALRNKRTGVICVLLLLAMLLTSCTRGSSVDTLNTALDSEIIPVESDDPLAEVDEMIGYLRYQTSNGTQFAPVFDVQGTIIKQDVNWTTLRETFGDVAKQGYTRVYIVVPNEGYSSFASMKDTAPVKTRYSKLDANVRDCGDPVRMYASVAHSLKLEAVAIYKPYEGGGGLTVPEGQVADNANWYEEVPGGRRTYFETFITEHPEMRIKRRDDAHIVDDRPITKIEMVFMLDQVTDKNHLDDTITIASTTARYVGKPTVTLYGSSDNYTYQKYEGSFNTSWETDKRDVYDANGRLLYSNANVYVMTIDGFDFADGTDYIAFTFSDADKGKLLTLPYSMTSVYCGNEKVASSVTVWARRIWEASSWVKNDTPGNHTWGFEFNPLSGGDFSFNSAQFTNYFTQWGFEFEYEGSGYQRSGWINSNGYCVTKGKPQYVSGTLCEGYAEVREHWLDYVKYLSEDCDYDAVDIRLQNHASFITDPINYGYNEPIVEKYKELYGVDISDPSVTITEDMYVKIMKIRGEFFEMFLEEAAEYLHANHKKIFIHLIADYANEDGWSLDTHSLNKIASPYRPKIILDWKKCVDLADEVIVKNFWWNMYDANAALEIKKYAYEQGKTCWVHVYVYHGDATLRFVQRIIDDPYATGVLWYEYNGPQHESVGPVVEKLDLSRVTVYLKK